ncbi:hypothetical protein BGZ73_008826 [Actinomortierella ambigua]|nr:hypothetical protein BGZ73_008826 [Actinomortierella ambigua]
MESILQETQSKLMPFLSSIVGNNTIVTLMTAYHLAVSTLLDASNGGSASFSFESSTFPGQDTFSNDGFYNGYEQQHQQQQHYQGGSDRRPLSVWQIAAMGAYYVFSFVHSMVSQILHAQLSSTLSPSALSLASLVFTCMIAVLLLRIAISLVLSIFRSVLWLLQTAVIMTMVGVAIWVFYHLTSGFSSSSYSESDPSTEAWNREYARQQQEYQKMFKNR